MVITHRRSTKKPVEKKIEKEEVVVPQKSVEEERRSYKVKKERKEEKTPVIETEINIAEFLKEEE